MTIEINGMAHVILTVSRFDLARVSYGKLLPEFGMEPVNDGARTAIGIAVLNPYLKASIEGSREPIFAA
jgi:hypothetical protein